MLGRLDCIWPDYRQWRIRFDVKVVLTALWRVLLLFSGQTTAYWAFIVATSAGMPMILITRVML